MRILDKLLLLIIAGGLVWLVSLKLKQAPLLAKYRDLVDEAGWLDEVPVDHWTATRCVTTEPMEFRWRVRIPEGALRTQCSLQSAEQEVFNQLNHDAQTESVFMKVEPGEGFVSVCIRNFYHQFSWDFRAPDFIIAARDQWQVEVWEPGKQYSVNETKALSLIKITLPTNVIEQALKTELTKEERQLAERLRTAPLLEYKLGESALISGHEELLYRRKHDK